MEQPNLDSVGNRKEKKEREKRRKGKKRKRKKKVQSRVGRDENMEQIIKERSWWGGYVQNTLCEILKELIKMFF